ncbi:MAG TPA: MBL fold metallo-hydrolase [Planctomycetota bacterium]|nr:MBL fold metallo-hydrolase [Planctomycetota bacterium]
MPSPALRRPENVAGDLYVDETCIDCDTCRWMAPATFDSAGDKSRVHHQPQTRAELQRALMALVACPTASIGATEHHDMKPVLAAFPDRLADLAGRPAAEGAAPGPQGVYHCGYHHEDSFGATSYLVVRPAGNVLVDSPRFAAPLVKRIEALGGVRTLFLTHQDDVADHDKWHKHFGCERILHAADVGAHTRGSACLLLGEQFLFTGDHLAWSERRGQIVGFRDACWYDWDTLVQSTRRLLPRRFSWLLPGHGRRCHFAPDEMARQMQRCLDWMARPG